MNGGALSRIDDKEVSMGSGKGNKHAQKRIYKKRWRGSKAQRNAEAAKKAYHQPKLEKKDDRPDGQAG